MPEYTVDQLNARIKADSEMTQLFKDDPTEFEVRATDIYKRFGYNADGTPMSTAMKGIGKVSRATGIPEEVVQGVANMPIPIATTIAGTMAGSFAPGPGNLVGGIAGSVAGEYANYALGLRDKPGPVDVGLAAVAPAVGPLASRAKSALSNIGQSLPGAGRTMHNLAADTIKQKLSYMEVSREEVSMVRGLFEAVPDFRTDVPMLRAAVKTELNLVTKSLTPDTAYIKQLNELTRNLSKQKNVSFKSLMSTENDLNKMKESAPSDIWAKLSGTLISDLEAQAQNLKLTENTRTKIFQGVEAFKNYIAVNNRFKGQEALKSLLTKSVKEVDDDLVRFDKKAFLKSLHTDKGLKVFEPTELADMETAIKDLGFIGMAPKSMSLNKAQIGSLGTIGTAAYVFGGGLPAVLGVVGVAGLINRGLSTDLGRRAITHLAKQGHGTINAVELKEMLGKITAGVSSGIVAGVSGIGTQTGSGVQPFVNQE